MKVRELVNGIKFLGRMLRLPDTDGNGGDLADLVRKAIRHVVGEVADDGRLSTAEVVETVGLAARWAAEMPAFAGWAGPLGILNRWAIQWAIDHGEDGE